MQDARRHGMHEGIGASDVDQGRTFQFGEQSKGLRLNFGLQPFHGIVEDDPFRLCEQQMRKTDGFLLFGIEQSIPASLRIETALQTAKPYLVDDGIDGGIVIGVPIVRKTDCLLRVPVGT